MNGDNAQNGALMGNEAVRQFLELLMRERPDAGQAYAVMLGQMEDITKQRDAARRELSEVRGQLAKMQEGPEKGFLLRITDAVGKRIQAMRQGLAEMKERIVTGAKEAVEAAKQSGIKALDKAVSVIGIKRGLEAMQESLSYSISDIKRSIEKVETMGKELRSVGGHLKNAGRAIVGKEQKAVDGGTEGRFQAAILAPMRTEKGILDRMNNLVLAAIGSVERLEEAGERARSGSGREERQEDIGGADRPRGVEPLKAESKAEEKPSVLKELQEGKLQAASHTAPAAEKVRKVQEAAI